jgi:hypothetical protein
MLESRSFLTIETRKDSAVHVSLSSSLLVKQPGTEGSTCIARPTTIDNRQLSAACSLIGMRSIRGATLCLGRGQNRAALSGRVIGQPDPRCQRPLSTNRRIVEKVHRAPISPDLSGLSCSPRRTRATFLRRSGKEICAGRPIASRVPGGFGLHRFAPPGGQRTRSAGFETQSARFVPAKTTVGRLGERQFEPRYVTRGTIRSCRGHRSRT